MKNKKTAVVVIPTYNEAANIGEMLKHLATKTFPSIKSWTMFVLVVDGNSPDGTAKVVKKFTQDYSSIKLLVQKEKNGIGGGYLDGFSYAKTILHADVVFEMDGDFQHPPEDIPLYLKKIEDGYDYVCGSRKIKGGSNPKGWGLKRLFFSEAGGFVARTILFFPTKLFFKVTDPTTGFKATRVNPFIDGKLLSPDHLYSKSFGYKLQFLFETLKKGAKYSEVPLRFGLRTAGESKIEPQTAKEIFIIALKLRLNDPVSRKFFKFGIVGFVGFLINSASLEFFRGFTSHFPNPSALAAAYAAEFSIVCNFTLNNFWTFRHEKHRHIIKVFGKLIQFNLTSLGAILIQFIAIGFGTHFFGDTRLIRQIFLVISIVFFIMPYNWTMYNKIIWKKKVVLS